MKILGRNARILIITLAVISCDNNIIISQKISHVDPKLFIQTIHNDEQLPTGVRELINHQAEDTKMLVKFPVSYYLIPSSETKYFRTKKFNTNISDQLFFIVSGEKYYKFFLPADSEKIYSFLNNGYRYIGPYETEFYGSRLSSDKTLVIWNAKNLSKTPFIVKTRISSSTSKQESSRFPAAEKLMDTPEMFNLIFKRKISGTTEQIDGQQITEVPKL